MNAKLNKRERRAQQLLVHYATCERLALALGMPAAKVDGKKASVGLWKLERAANNAATAQCNGESYQGQPYREDEAWEDFETSIRDAVSRIFGRSHMHPIPGFFVNGDPRGAALKIDPEKTTPEIRALGLTRDWGGYLLLSPDITGD